ncbi:MAG: restriction endonuclease subunit S [Saprospiraceae bacterium]|nr:restriction endonuclease subunit S [Saprospiraceae bacterium]
MAAETKNVKQFYNTEIPSDWEVVEFGEIVNYKKGFAFKNEDYSQQGVRILRVSDTNASGIKKEGVVFLESSRAIDFKTWMINENDIIIQTVGSRPPLYDSMVGKTILVQKEFAGSLLNQNAVRIRMKMGNNFFLYSHFTTKRYFDFIETLVRGNANQVSITLDELFKFKIPLPPLTEQLAIARVLSTWDEAIHTTEKLIAQKELRKKWLMQNLLTGKLRLRSVSGLQYGGEWKKLGAGEVFKSITIKGFADEELLSATQDRGMIPRTMLEGRVTMPTTGTEGFKLIEIGDFVISLRSFQGGIEYSYYRGLVSPAYTVLKPKKQINEEFYKQYFKSYEFIGRLATAVIGIRDGKQISYDDFCIVKIPYPTIEEQTAIAQVLKAADEEINLLKAKVEKLREQKRGLMQVLLTGRVRLKY